MHKVLIVDDEEINRQILELGLADIYDIVQAGNGQEALDLLYLDESFEALLLDINMPKMNGYEVLKDLNDSGLIKQLPVFIITGEDNNDELVKAYELGADAIISKPFNMTFLRRQIGNLIELYFQRNHLELMVNEKTKELINQNNRLVEAMANIVEFRSYESGTHIKRVRGYTQVLMEGLVNDYPELLYLKPDIERISFAACLHDIGKISIPDSILNKPGKYTNDDYEVMKTHTVKGYEQVLTLRDIMDPKLFAYSLDIARHHHERYNGRGYPDKISGEEITIWSQAVAIADVYDALTRERCYKEAYDHETACNMILKEECGAFNPKVLSVFEKSRKKFNDIRQDMTRPRVLIVDNSELDRASLKTILHENFDVDEYSSANEAITHLKKDEVQYDIIIVDVHMPEMDGFEFMNRLGSEFLSKVRMVMCSSEVAKSVVTKAASFGVRAFLKKPFDFETTLARIYGVIGGKP